MIPTAFEAIIIYGNKHIPTQKELCYLLVKVLHISVENAYNIITGKAPICNIQTHFDSTKTTEEFE